jgi:hypothetical protein
MANLWHFTLFLHKLKIVESGIFIAKYLAVEAPFSTT